jgi:hypothetical protein
MLVLLLLLLLLLPVLMLLLLLLLMLTLLLLLLLVLLLPVLLLQLPLLLLPPLLTIMRKFSGTISALPKKASGMTWIRVASSRDLARLLVTAALTPTFQWVKRMRSTWHTAAAARV